MRRRIVLAVIDRPPLEPDSSDLASNPFDTAGALPVGSHP
jgi:hypothetical protein